MNIKLILLGLVGVGLIIYLIKKLSPGETNVVSQLVPVGRVENNSGVDSRLAYEANKTSAFTALLGLAQTQTEAEVAKKNIDNSVTLEAIRGNTGIEINRQDNETTRQSFSRDITLGNMLSKTQIDLARLQGEKEQVLQRDYLESILEQLSLENAFKQAQTTQQINALNTVAQTYRNQSLERQGTILNAFTSTFNGQAPYTYQSAFGGSRPPTFLQQLSGFASSIGLGGLLGKWF